jgi:hypothetical protein
MRGSHIKLSQFSAIAWNVRQRPDRFHACRRAPPLHSMRQEFENAGVCFWHVLFMRTHGERNVAT